MKKKVIKTNLSMTKKIPDYGWCMSIRNFKNEKTENNLKEKTLKQQRNQNKMRGKFSHFAITYLYGSFSRKLF